MTATPANGYISDDDRTQAEGKTFLETLLSIAKEMPGGSGAVTLTISGDAITPAAETWLIKLLNQSGAGTDDLKTINTTNVRDGQLLFITAGDAAQVPRIFHGGGGSGQIQTASGQHISLSPYDYVVVRWDLAATTWKEVLHSPSIENPISSTAAKVWATDPTSTSQFSSRTLGREHLDTALHNLPGFKAKVTKQLASDKFTPGATDGDTIEVQAETGSTDTLTYINYSNVPDGSYIRIYAYSGHSFTLTHNGGSPGASEAPLYFYAGSNQSMSGYQSFLFQRVGTLFIERGSTGYVGSDASLFKFGGYNGPTSLRPILSIPGAPTLGTAGTAGTTTRKYRIVAKDAGGTITAAGAEATIPTSNATLTGSNYVTLSWTAVTGATAYDIYRTTSGGTPSTTGKIATVTTNSYNDTGAAGDSSSHPTTHLWIGEYFHVGNYATDAAATAYTCRIHVVGTWTNTHAITVSPEMSGGAASSVASAYSARSGRDGQGPGGGQGATGVVAGGESTGGGGGGHGGAGGSGAGGSGTVPFGLGGPAYTMSHFLPGSGGGAGFKYTTAGGAGGSGGGGFAIIASSNITVSANITATGSAGTAGGSGGVGAYDGGGGGGSGGGVLLATWGNLTISGGVTISVAGGAGGAGGSGGSWLVGGAGGSGGIVYGRAVGTLTNSGTITVSGGAAGTSTSATVAATAGASGVSDLAGSAGFLWRSAA